MTKYTIELTIDKTKVTSIIKDESTGLVMSINIDNFDKMNTSLENIKTVAEPMMQLFKPKETP